MITFLSIVLIGFFLGMRHATDPDHVIAVTTIVTQQRKLSRAALIGAFWGVGHTLTIFVVGAAIIFFNLVIPARLGLSMELAVGVMLVILGVANIASFLKAVPGQAEAERGAPIVHNHSHSHGNLEHTHPHVHFAGSHSHQVRSASLSGLDGSMGRFAIYQQLRPLLIGIVHGLAGSAAVALLVLSTIRNPNWAVAYLLVFGIGTIAGMMVITMGIAGTLNAVGNRYSKLARHMGLASGVISLAFGLVVAYQICVVNALFTAHPNWTPR
jgi:high-affinity nickel-transport protein